MKILVATNQLVNVGGTENYTYTLLQELKRRNIDVEYFTLNKGRISSKIENELKIPYFSKNKYDLILANHNTTVNLLWKYGFTIQTCHGIFPKLEQPSPLADAYVSISQEVQEHLALQSLPSLIITNGINCERFNSFKPINEKIKSVASFCQTDEANMIVQEACDALDLELIKVNKFKENEWNVESIINKVDLVVGLGRSAYDAMACGRPVVVFDKRPYSESFGDGYLTPIIGLSLQNNCSGRFLKRKFTTGGLVEEFKKYNPEDGKIMREFALHHLNIQDKVDRYLDFYKNVKNIDRSKLLKVNVKKFLYYKSKPFIIYLKMIKAMLRETNK